MNPEVRFSLLELVEERSFHVKASQLCENVVKLSDSLLLVGRQHTLQRTS
jgi:hypothetical protein